MYCLLTDVYIRRLLFIRFMNKWCRYFVTVQIHSGMRGPIAGVNRSNVWIFCDGMFWQKLFALPQRGPIYNLRCYAHTESDVIAMYSSSDIHSVPFDRCRSTSACTTASPAEHRAVRQSVFYVPSNSPYIGTSSLKFKSSQRDCH